MLLLHVLLADPGGPPAAGDGATRAAAADLSTADRVIAFAVAANATIVVLHAASAAVDAPLISALRQRGWKVTAPKLAPRLAFTFATASSSHRSRTPTGDGSVTPLSVLDVELLGSTTGKTVSVRDDGIAPLAVSVSSITTTVRVGPAAGGGGPARIVSFCFFDVDDGSCGAQSSTSSSSSLLPLIAKEIHAAAFAESAKHAVSSGGAAPSRIDDALRNPRSEVIVGSISGPAVVSSGRWRGASSTEPQQQALIRASRIKKSLLRASYVERRRYNGGDAISSPVGLRFVLPIDFRSLHHAMLGVQVELTMMTTTVGDVVAGTAGPIEERGSPIVWWLELVRTGEVLARYRSSASAACSGSASMTMTAPPVEAAAVGVTTRSDGSVTTAYRGALLRPTDLTLEPDEELRLIVGGLGRDVAVRSAAVALQTLAGGPHLPLTALPKTAGAVAADTAAGGAAGGGFFLALVSEAAHRLAQPAGSASTVDVGFPSPQRDDGEVVAAAAGFAL